MEKAQNWDVTAHKRRPGRPTLLDAQTADRLVALVAQGRPLSAAARGCGVSPRTLVGWRARAWSRDAADQPHVELERRVQQALGAAQARREREQADPLSLDRRPDWQAAALALEAAYPERWALPDEVA